MNQQELMRALSYDKDTGVFRWIEKRKGISVGSVAGCLMRHGYISICINRVDYTAHRLAWLYVYGEWPKNYIDHINGKRNDNRIENLRDVSQVVNMQNVYAPRSDNKCGVRGVSFHKPSRKYTARITVGKKYVSLGLFNTVEEAGNAYMDAKRRFHEGCVL